jgi:predicted dienelactone hydrolase
MRAFLCLLAVGFAMPLHGAEAPPPEILRVLAPLPAGPQITPYLAYQLERAWAFDAQRQERFARVKTEADLVALQEELRAKALRIMGGLPSEKTPLNARVVGSVPMDGYRIDKLVFESLPGIHVTALLYVPEAPSGRKPAVLLACGHSEVGKAYARYQEIAARLARRGYVVVCWDPVGQGERSQFWDRARGRSRYNLVCGEHAVLGNLATLAGTSLVRYAVWDGMRAVDYLLTRDDVDAERIAITGTSGGGFQSTWIGALDRRIRAVLPSQIDARSRAHIDLVAH